MAALASEFAARKRSKSAPSQNEQPAIGKGDDIRLPRPARQKRHLAKELATPKPDAARRQSDFDGTGSNKEYGIAPVSLTDNALARHGETRPQQLGDAPQLLLI